MIRGELFGRLIYSVAVPDLAQYGLSCQPEAVLGESLDLGVREIPPWFVPSNGTHATCRKGIGMPGRSKVQIPEGRLNIHVGRGVERSW